MGKVWTLMHYRQDFRTHQPSHVEILQSHIALFCTFCLHLWLYVAVLT